LDLRRHWFFSVSHELLDKGSDGSAGERDVFDAAANNIAVCYGNHMGDPVPGVHHCTCQGSLLFLKKKKIYWGLTSILLGE
jgi:hypothetical protein